MGKNDTRKIRADSTTRLKIQDNTYIDLFVDWLLHVENKLYRVNLLENFTYEQFIDTLNRFNKEHFKVEIPIEVNKLKSLFEIVNYNRDKLK